MRMRPRHRIIARPAAILTVCAILLAALIVSGCASDQQPTVDALAANYHAHRQQFRTMALLASVDATFGIDVSSGSLGSNTIQSADVPRYSEILAALDAIGAQHLSASDHELDVTTASEGLAVSGRESGYYYTTSSDVETVTLDVARSPDAPRLWFYPLGEGWYAAEYRF